MVGIAKPFRRTCRPGVDGKYPDDTRESYIADQRYACAPEQYVLAFELIQKDLLELFDYIEPAHLNRQCYSYRIHELLMRTCVEVEANCKAVAGQSFRRFGSFIGVDQGYNLNVPARLLLNGDFTFCPIRYFKDLAGQATTSAR
jgi:hypothetical protein